MKTILNYPNARQSLLALLLFAATLGFVIPNNTDASELSRGSTGTREATTFATSEPLGMPPLPAPEGPTKYSNNMGTFQQFKGVQVSRESGNPQISIWNGNRDYTARVTIRYNKYSIIGQRYELKFTLVSGGSAVRYFDQSIYKNLELITAVLTPVGFLPESPAIIPTGSSSASSNSSSSGNNGSSTNSAFTEVPGPGVPAVVSLPAISGYTPSGYTPPSSSSSSGSGNKATAAQVLGALGAKPPVKSTLSSQAGYMTKSQSKRLAGVRGRSQRRGR